MSAQIDDLEQDIKDRELFLEGLKHALSILKKPSQNQDNPSIAIHSFKKEEVVHLQAGSMIEKARVVLEEAGYPLHINKILELLGTPKDEKIKVSLTATFNKYTKSERVFKRTAPNTFALIEAKVGV
jgi:hypothetical protein